MELTPDNVRHLLEASFDSNQVKRQEAEFQLKQFEQFDGFIQVLSLVLNSNVSDSLKQAVAITIKNRVRRSWSGSDTPIGPQDKLFLKSNIINFIVTVNIKSRPMFAVCINNILSTEYPENWPEFLPTIKNIMSSQDKHTIDAALLILWELFNIYRYKSTDKREPLNIMISETFSQLFNTCNSLIALNEPEAGKMVHMILKIYYAAVQFELSPLLQSEPSITQWLTLFVTVIEKQVTINESLDEQEREQYSWFKAKKWALHCVYHLFVKYAIAPQNSGDLKYAQFSSIFMNNFAPNILNVYLNQVGLISSGTWTSNRVKQQISLFLTDCVKQKNLWLIMKPNLELIVVKYIFPILCVTDFDLYQWESDPVEYIQRKLDVMQDFKSSVTAAQELLTGIVKNRFKQTFIPIISFVNEILSAYNSTSVELRDARKKDGAINLISCLANEMLGKKSPILDRIEEFIALNVLPEFNSTNNFLKVRTCDFLMKFENVCLPITTSGLLKNEANIDFVFASLLKCIQDPDLPVRVWAALTLREYLQYEKIRENLKPHVINVMQILLNLTNEIDMDTLSQVMETIAETYPNELVPFAIQLGTQLTASFLRIVEDLDMDDEEVEINSQVDKTMNAIGIMKTISTLVISLNESSSLLLGELEVVVSPVITTVLEKNLVDLFDDCFEIIDSLTFCLKTITPTMVNILPLIYNSFQKNSTDYFEEMLPSLDNYLSFGTPNLKESREFQSMMFNIIQQVFSQVDAGEAEYVRACQLSESFLLNLSSIDEIIPKFIDLALNVLNNFDAIKTTSYKVQCIEIVVNCIYNNPIVALSYLDSRQALLSFFGLWKNNLGNFKRVHDKRLAILTICKLIWIDFRGIDRMELLACLVSLFDGYKEALEERERMDAMYNGGESEDDDEYDEMESDNEDSDFEDDVQDDDDEYLKYLKESAANRANEDDEEDDDDEDEWGVSGLEEDPYFVTILDKIDPHIVFQDTLGKLTVEDQNMFAGSLTEAQRAVLDNVILAAVAGRQKATSN